VSRPATCLWMVFAAACTVAACGSRTGLDLFDDRAAVRSSASSTSSGSSSSTSSGLSSSSGTSSSSSSSSVTTIRAGCTVSADCVAPEFCWLGECVTLTAVSVFDADSCALTTRGGVQCWGDNTSGQLGNDSTTASSVPVPVSQLASGVAAISVGETSACAVTTAGGVVCWGDNTFGQLGNNSTIASSVPVPVSGLASGVASVAAGLGFACALTTAGGVLCWGTGDASDATDSLVPVPVPGLSSGIRALRVSGTNTCAVTLSGGALCLGDNEEGQLGNDTVTPNSAPVAVSGLASGVADIAAGLYFECALTDAGGVLCWGANEDGEIGNNSTAQTRVPVAVSGLSPGVTAISAGFGFACAVTSGGGVQCWGANDAGQLGNDSTTFTGAPVGVTGLSSGIAKIAANGADSPDHACALTTGGRVLCWGANGSGQLGNGSTTQSLVPVSVVEP